MRNRKVEYPLPAGFVASMNRRANRPRARKIAVATGAGRTSGDLSPRRLLGSPSRQNDAEVIVESSVTLMIQGSSAVTSTPIWSLRPGSPRAAGGRFFWRALSTVVA